MSTANQSKTSNRHQTDDPREREKQQVGVRSSNPKRGGVRKRDSSAGEKRERGGKGIWKRDGGDSEEAQIERNCV